VKVSADLDAELAKTKEHHQEYLNKMRTHTDRAKHTLGLKKMLGEKKVQLDKKEQYLTLQEAHARGLNPYGNREELTGLIDLQKSMDEAEVARVVEAGQLAILVEDIFRVLMDLGMPPILRILQDSGKASDVLKVVGTILECLREAYASGAGLWD
jgi:hypothetical protein